MTLMTIAYKDDMFRKSEVIETSAISFVASNKVYFFVPELILAKQNEYIFVHSP